jgi:hypothetical protein
VSLSYRDRDRRDSWNRFVESYNNNYAKLAGVYTAEDGLNWRYSPR